MILSLFRRVCQAILLGEPVTCLRDAIEKVGASHDEHLRTSYAALCVRDEQRKEQMTAVNHRIGGVAEDTLCLRRELAQFRDDLAKARARKARRKR